MQSIGDFAALSFLFSVMFIGVWVGVSIVLNDDVIDFIKKIENYKKRNSIKILKNLIMYFAPIIFVPLIWIEDHKIYKENRSVIESSESIIHKNTDGTLDVRNLGNDVIRIYEGEITLKNPSFSWEYSDFAAGKNADTGQLSLRKKYHTQDQNDEVCDNGKCVPFTGTKVIYDHNSNRFDVWNHSDKKLRIENRSGGEIITVKPDHYAEGESK